MPRIHFLTYPWSQLTAPSLSLLLSRAALCPAVFQISRHFTGISITNASYAFLCELTYAEILNRDG